MTDNAPPSRIGRYEILRRLGEGGMGVVYVARDPDLDRQVALKTLKVESRDDTARRRFRREARAAARVSHPGVCQIFEVGEDDGELFIIMELLEGASLAERLVQGPLALPEAVAVAVGTLEALEALHGRDVVHRDLKPSNVFLTSHGVKLLDFGVARHVSAEALAADTATGSLLTQTGMLVGTPPYMSPEHVRGETLDHRADLFALAAILHEMLTGKRAFPGRTVMEVLHAILYESPPVLGGSPAIAAVDAVIRRGLARDPSDRPPSARAMAEQLRQALLLQDSGQAPRPHAMTRLIVLPFRMLRPDPDSDFLAVSLPDAITASLSGLSSIVVRSSAVAARFTGDAPDLRVVAEEADVDVVLTGTLLKAGAQLRVSTQLQEAPSGTLVWSQSTTGTLQDVFALEDQIVQRTVESLSASLSAREQRLLRRDVPATARAYELYLRGNQLSAVSKGWEVALEMYRQCLREDPRYAPAWARLGRVYRVLAKYVREDADRNLTLAEEAFHRALSLNPDLPLAHVLYAQFEVEAGRPIDALRRLLGQARAGSADPDIFVGLVQVCRYCGLLEASLAAERQVRRLDPHARTSVSYTHVLLGDYERALATDVEDVGYSRLYALALLGRTEEAVAGYREMEGHPHPLNRELGAIQRAVLEGRGDDAVDASRRFLASGFRDPEGLYWQARVLARCGQAEEALALLRRVVEGGFYCGPTLERDPWLAPLRERPEMGDLVAEAHARTAEAARAFAEAGGPALLGLLA
jgi:serine/threonine protein kinase